MTSHKAGFVNIIGNPNVGKSTLMNAIIGEKLSIVTHKSQTTRHRILGILNTDDYQIVFSDTPGILEPKYKMQEAMMKYITLSLDDADVILYVTDTVEQSDKHEKYIRQLQKKNIPIIIIINKIDLTSSDNLIKLMNYWHDMLPQAEIYPTSALYQPKEQDLLLHKIVFHLPISPPYYDKNTFTDKSLRFFASEILREKILLHYEKEIPYCTEVVIEEFVEGEDLYRISAVINVMRNSQKNIIIGHQGSMIKKVATEARKDMEEFFQRKVFLTTFVKVEPDWRNNEYKLRQFGYHYDNKE